jgi:type IV pilus assembly protein PilN
MIRINLLAVEREKTKRKSEFHLGQKASLLSSLILVLTVVGIGWWYWSIDKRSKKMDADIQAAQAEAARLNTIIQQVRTFEQQRTQLQQRVTLIQQLRRGQTGAVHMLDEISRSLPETLWLTEMKQTGPDIVIDGRCTTLTSLSDFVAALNKTGYFSKDGKGVDLVSSQVESTAAGATGTPIIKFQVKAKFTMPGA